MQDEVVVAPGWARSNPVAASTQNVGAHPPHPPASEASAPVASGSVPLAARASTRPTNYARSALHFTSASIGLTAVALLSHKNVLLIALAFATYAWSMEIGRRLYPPLNVTLMRFYGRVAHPHEHFRVNSATWYATALVVLALWVPRPATMASLAVLGVADPVAGMVGRRWGKRILRAGRSLEGSLAFVLSGSLVAALALVLAGGVAPMHVLLLAPVAGVAGALAELVATRLDDNLTIPLAVGGAVAAAAALIS